MKNYNNQVYFVFVFVFVFTLFFSVEIFSQPSDAYYKADRITYVVNAEPDPYERAYVIADKRASNSLWNGTSIVQVSLEIRGSSVSSDAPIDIKLIFRDLYGDVVNEVITESGVFSSPKQSRHEITSFFSDNFRNYYMTVNVKHLEYSSAYVIKLNQYGDVIWKQEIRNESSSITRISDGLKASNLSRLYLVGHDTEGAFVICLGTAGGSVLFKKKYNTTIEDNANMEAISILENDSPTGASSSFFIGGCFSQLEGYNAYEVILMEVEADGSIKWASHVNEFYPSIDFENGICIGKKLPILGRYNEVDDIKQFPIVIGKDDYVFENKNKIVISQFEFDGSIVSNWGVTLDFGFNENTDLKIVDGYLQDDRSIKILYNYNNGDKDLSFYSTHVMNSFSNGATMFNISRNYSTYFTSLLQPFSWHTNAAAFGGTMKLPEENSDEGNSFQAMLKLNSDGKSPSEYCLEEESAKLSATTVKSNPISLTSIPDNINVILINEGSPKITPIVNKRREVCEEPFGLIGGNVSQSSLLGQQNESESSNYNVGESTYSIKVYPNPVGVGEKITLLINTEVEGDFFLDVYDSYGNNIYKESFTKIIGEYNINLNPDKRMKSGLYYITLKSSKGISQKKIIIAE